MRASSGLSAVALHLDGDTERLELSRLLSRIFADAALRRPRVLSDIEHQNDPEDPRCGLHHVVLAIADALKAGDYRLRLSFPVAEDLRDSLLDACPQRSVA